MLQPRLVEDLEECRRLWEQAFEPENLWDLWEVRACFHRHFARPTVFVALEEGARLVGLLPLSYVEESGTWGMFPGETWRGRTWLEQNRILAPDEACLQALLEAAPRPCSLRYLLPQTKLPSLGAQVDEVGYLFLPPRCDYSADRYFKTFSHRSEKRLRRDLAALEELQPTWRLDRMDDYELLVRLNRDRFGEYSYFHDPRFARGFHELTALLRGKGWLRMTSVFIDGQPAAVDMGCIRQGHYTLLAGGTEGDYPGIAKLINLHHIQRACAERVDLVDFLCGDFSWKTLFHLTQRPLYLLEPHAAPE